MTSTRRFMLIAAATFLAAIAGVFIGRIFAVPDRASETELHALLHNDVKLDAAQDAKIDALEERHAARKTALEHDMRAANAQLADAIKAEQGYGPKVTAAIEHSHHVMGQLQKETLEHLFAMRAVLTPEQAKMFDASVTKALTAKPQ